jgi:hypothetical protein
MRHDLGFRSIVSTTYNPAPRDTPPAILQCRRPIGGIAPICQVSSIEVWNIGANYGTVRF